MMMPSTIRDNFFSGWMTPFDELFDFSKNFFGNNERGILKTDVKEVNGNYELDMELPGFKKEDINASLKDGYLTIQANQHEEKDEKDSEGNYIRRERYQGSCSRSFYVGEGVRQEDINARFDNGVLHIIIPKAELPSEDNRYIRIEG